MRSSSADENVRRWRVMAVIVQARSLEQRLSAMLFTWCSLIPRALRDTSFNLESSECSQPERGRPPRDLLAEATRTITTRHWPAEILFFRNEHQNLARDSSVTRAQFVHFDRDSPNRQVDREAAAMLNAVARLQLFQNVPSNYSTWVEITEIVGLVEGIAFQRTDNRTDNFLIMSCSFREVAFKCQLDVFDAATRVIRLTWDNRTFDESRVRSLPVGSSRSTLIAANSGNRPSFVSANTVCWPADRAARRIVRADILMRCIAASSDLNVNTALLRCARAFALYLSTTSQDIHSNLVALFHGTGILIFVIVDFKNCSSIGSVNGCLSDNELFIFQNESIPRYVRKVLSTSTERYFCANA